MSDHIGDNLEPFQLERYFGEHEFSSKYLLSSSDCDTISVQSLLAQSKNDEVCQGLWNNLALGYTDTMGLRPLREQIASMYTNNSAGLANITSDNIVVAAPGELIYLVMHAMLRRGDEVIVMCPAYQSLHSVARSIGCVVKTWPLEVASTQPGAQKMVWRMNLDVLKGLLTDRTRMVVVNLPNNPTGFLPAIDDFKALTRLIAEQTSDNCYLFCDEMYRHLQRSSRLLLPSAVERCGNAIVLSGLSKTYGLPGLRIGWVVCRDAKVIQGCLSMKDYTTICNSAPSEVLAMMALRCCRERLIEDNNRIVLHNEGILQRFCDNHHRWIEYVDGRGGSTVFLKWIGEEPLEDTCQEALRSCGVMVVPGRLFDEDYAHYFRIGLGRKNLEEGLSVFSAFLHRSVKK